MSLIKNLIYTLIRMLSVNMNLFFTCISIICVNTINLNVIFVCNIYFNIIILIWSINIFIILPMIIMH